MNTEKFVVGIRRQLLRNKRNYFACCPNVKTNSCMEMNVLNSHRNIFCTLQIYTPHFYVI